ncbi:hypothetical protein ACVIRO_002374 [Rhizobium ruizarguesonis]
MSQWNHDMASAPIGTEKIVTRTVKGKPTAVKEYHVDAVWLATKDGKVHRSYWIPTTAKVEGRWSGFSVGSDQPVAWQPYIVPDHPGALTALERIQAKLITHKHTFADDVGSGA